MALFNDIVTRFYLNGDWRDVSTSVRADRGITYSRGRQGEDDITPPQTCSFDLDSRTGTWSDRNPLGPYYGHLRRNTPAEVSLRVVKDTCGTTVANGWGSTDTGTGSATGAWQVESWTVVGTTSNYAKGSGVATHSIASAGSTRTSYLANYRGRDVDVSFTVQLSVTNVTGGAQSQGIAIGNVLLRGQGALSSFFQLRLVAQTNETFTMEWWTQNGAGDLSLGTVTVPGIVHVNTNVYRVRAQVEGRELRAKMWVDGTSEPYGWVNSLPVETEVTDAAGLYDTQGWVGVRSEILTGCTNTNITVSYDDFEVRTLVFAGEISEWPQERDVTGGDRVVSVVASGLRRRMVQGKSLAHSALYDYTLNVGSSNQKDPHVYFPLEGGEQTGLDVVDIMGTTSRLSFNQPNSGSSVGKISWGADTLLPGSRRSPTITGGGSLNATIEPATDELNWAVQWQQRMNFREGSTATFQTSAGSGGGQITVIPNQPAGSSTISVGLQAPGVSNNNILSYTFDSEESVDEWHTFAISAETITPGSTDFFFFVDGEVTGASFTQSSLNNAPLVYIGFASLPDSTGTISIGHISIYSGDLGAWAFSAADDAASGYPGESGIFRAFDLSDKYGLLFAYFSETFVFADAGSKPMGSRRVVPLVQLFDDCEHIDGGILYEQRGAVGLQFRGLRTMQSRTPFLTLDMGTSKHLSPPLRATSDDRGIVNAATAQRADGGEWTYTRTDGPLGSSPAISGGIGEYPKSFVFNAQLETDLQDLASWQVAKGTVDQERYPAVVVELHRPSILNTSGLLSKLRDLDVGELITLAGLDSNYVYEDPDEIVLGIRGYLDKFRHTLTLNTTPDEVYRTLIIGSTAGASTEFSRLDSDSTTVDEALDATETGVTILVATGSTFWVNTTDHADHFPFDVMVGGERMTVTACTSPSGQNQTMTVTRNVNGLPGGKTHSTGAVIELARPNYYGL